MYFEAISWNWLVVQSPLALCNQAQPVTQEISTGWSPCVCIYQGLQVGN